MKLTRLVYIILLFILVSCSNSAIVSNHWVKYVNSNPEITNLSSSLNNNPVHPIRLFEFEDNFTNKDSIIIVTKTGKTYKGIVSKSDHDGYFIKVEKNREIYIGNFEIKSIQFIKNPTLTNVQTLAIDPTADTAILKPTISKEKVTESTDKSSLENDVWDTTNSEFEVSNSDSPKTEESSTEKVQEPLSILSFIFTLLGFLTGVGFLLGMIFGAISLSKIKKNPEKFKGKGIAKFSFILSTTVIVAVLFLFLLIVAILL
jgi:hypothetical protein